MSATDRERAEQRLHAQYVVSRVLAESTTLSEATPKILQAICKTTGWEVGAIWGVDSVREELYCVELWHSDAVSVTEFLAASRQRTFAPGIGLPGRVWESGQPAWIPDVTKDANFPRAPFASKEGLHAALGFPIRLGKHILGVIEFFSREIREPDEALLQMVNTIGEQVGQFIERRRAERQLRESEARKRAMLEAALDCVITINHESRILEWNQAAETTFGYPRAAVLGRDMAELIVPPALRQRHRLGFKRYLDTGDHTLLGQRVEMTALRADGTEFPVELAITKISLEGPPLFTAYLRDITERKLAEASLRASEIEFRAIFELAGSGKSQADPATGKFLRVNRKLCEITGYSDEELLSMTFSQITHAADRQKDLEEFQRLVNGEMSDYSGEKRYLRKDGKVIWVHVTTAVIRDSNGKALRTVGVVQDIDYRKRIEQALRESEERYRLILENALEYAILTLDQEGRVNNWNAGAQRILGFEEKEILGRRLDVIFTVEDREHGLLDVEMGRALTQGRAQDERWHLRKDGSPFWASGLMMPLKDEDGHHLGFLKILRDGTHRKRGEEALRESEARFRQLADAMPQIIWTARPDGCMDYCNKRWYEFTRCAEEQADEESWMSILHADDVLRWKERWSAAVKSGEPFELECRFWERQKGSYRWFLARSLPARSENGEILHWYGTFTDIDDQKQGEERFVRLNQTLISVLESLPDVVFVVAADGKIEFKNPAAGKFACAVEIVDSLPAPIQSELEQVMETGEHYLPTSFKTVHRFRINHDERYYLSRIVGMMTPGNDLFGAVVMLQDVTEFRLLDEVKTNLISTVSHELKTPITSVRTALLLLLEQMIGTLNSKQIELVGIARDEAERLLRTLDSLLDLTRFEEGAIGMYLNQVAPDELVRAAIEQTRVAAAAARISVKLELEQNLPILKADRERIIHALTNLLTNAIKYSPEESEIIVQARREGSQGVYFSVADRGPGVPSQFHSRIFERFFRVPGNAKTGAGLGLSIAREFVRAHRGRVGINSEPGQGSEFYFILPLADP